MKRMKLLGLLTVLSMSLHQNSEAISLSHFSDMNNHWAQSHVSTVVASGLMSGVSDNAFLPDGEMSIAHLAVTVVNGAFSGETLATVSDDHWADPYLNVLLDQGLLKNSKGADLFQVYTGWENQAVTRHQVASIVSRLMDAQSITPASLVYATGYADINSNDVVDLQDIANVTALGVMTGISNTEFGVSGTFTRGACCVVLSQLLGQDLLSSTIPSTPDVVVPEVVTPEIVTPEITINSSLPADTNGDGLLSQSELNVVFERFREEYPQGTKWTNDNSYFSSSMRTTGYGCAGWAFMVSDAIFGTSPRYVITRSQLQAGDIWHTGSHWGVVMEVQGNNYITTEGNYNSSIYWDVKRTQSYLTDSVTYYSRYPS